MQGASGQPIHSANPKKYTPLLGIHTCSRVSRPSPPVIGETVRDNAYMWCGELCRCRLLVVVAEPEAPRRRHRDIRCSRDTKNLPGKQASREGFWVSRYRVQEHFSVSREPSGKPGSRERFEHLGMRASREAGRAYLKILGSREATGVSRDTGFSRSSARYLRMPKCEKK